MNWTTYRDCEAWARAFVASFADTPQDIPYHDWYADRLAALAWSYRWDQLYTDECVGEKAASYVTDLAALREENHG